MSLLVGDTIAGTVVASSYANGNAEGCCGLEGLIHSFQGRTGPVHFRTTPTDRDNRGLVGLIMDGLGDGIKEAAICVGSEIDGYLRAGCYNSNDLDIQSNLTISAIGIARAVIAAINGDTDDLWLSYAKLLEVRTEIHVGIATTELDEANTFTGTGHSCREIVELRETCRRI